MCRAGMGLTGIELRLFFGVGPQVDNTHQRLCPTKTLSVENVKAFRKAVQDDYYFQVRAPLPTRQTNRIRDSDS